MKNFHFLVLFFLVFISAAKAQSPQAIPYQAVARNASGILIASQSIKLKFTIHNASAVGTIVYQETQAATTNAFGLFNLNIGAGTVISGTFTGIDWASGTKYLEIAIDITGGSSFTIMGTQQLLSVPYALFASKTVSNDYIYAAYVSSGTSQTVVVGGPFVFNNFTKSAAIVVNTFNTIVIAKTGIYQVSYYMTNINSTSRTIGIKVNSTLATNTPIVEVTAENIGSTAILALTAGDLVQLINTGSSSINTGSTNVCASLTVIQLQ